MQPILWLPLSCTLILILSGCANHGGAGNDPLGTGPFDSAGNYHEEWANDPSKWSKPGKRSPQPPAGDELPQIAKNEQPPPNANPLAPHSSPTQVKSRPAARETTRRTEEPKPTIAKSKPKSEPTVTKSKPKSEPTVTKSKPKPKPTVAKSKPKPKPKTTRYVVKQGDNLSTIASRTGSSVSAIKKANGLSGTLIHPGKSLVIPKR